MLLTIWACIVGSALIAIVAATIRDAVISDEEFLKRNIFGWRDI